jgi:hypothetical protein
MATKSRPDTTAWSIVVSGFDNMTGKMGKDWSLDDVCRLCQLFKHGKEEMTKYGRKFPVNIHTKGAQAAFRELAGYVIEEMDEARGCLKNRPWTSTETLVDIEHLHDEMADTLHFFIATCVLIGMTPESLMEAYRKKYVINEMRRRTNY